MLKCYSKQSNLWFILKTSREQSFATDVNSLIFSV